MRKFTLTLLASAALAVPTVVPAMAQTNPQTQPPMQHQQAQPQPNRQVNRNNGPQNQQQAANQPVSPRQLGHSGVRQVQQALDKDGFRAGRADGIYGPETQAALKDFQKSKNIQSNGQLDRQTLSDLGVKMASNQTMQGQNTMNQGGANNPAPNHH
jgi:peptidoglycan hydrolase-like protein with peptidoglycan-binding domain